MPRAAAVAGAREARLLRSRRASPAMHWKKCIAVVGNSQLRRVGQSPNAGRPRPWRRRCADCGGGSRGLESGHDLAKEPWIKALPNVHDSARGEHYLDGGELGRPLGAAVDGDHAGKGRLVHTRARSLQRGGRDAESAR
jgi:hypothetical protein